MEAGGVAQRHQQHLVLAKADDLGEHGQIAPARAQEAEIAQADVRALRLDDEPGDAGDRAQPLGRRDGPHLAAEGIDKWSDGGHQELARPSERVSSLVTRRASVRPKRLRTWQSPVASVASVLHLQTRVTLEPGGIELLEQTGVARAEDQLEVFAFREKLVECLAADAFDDFGRRFETRHEAAGEVEREAGQGGADLPEQGRLDVGELAEDPVLQLLHVGADVHQLAVGELPRGILPLTESLLPEGLDLGVRVHARRATRQEGAGERTVEVHEFCQWHDQATTACSASREIWPSSSSRCTMWMMASCAVSTSLSRTGPSMEISSRRLSAARLEMEAKIFSRSDFAGGLHRHRQIVRIDLAQHALQIGGLEAAEVLEAEHLLADQAAESGIALLEAGEQPLAHLLVQIVEQIGHRAHAAAAVEGRAHLGVEMLAEAADDLAHEFEGGALDRAQALDDLLAHVRAEQGEDLGGLGRVQVGKDERDRLWLLVLDRLKICRPSISLMSLITSTEEPTGPTRPMMDDALKSPLAIPRVRWA